jgi:hypothetical protein
MSNMVLGSYTFATQPSSMTMIQKSREVATVKTYASVALFSWGATIVGKTIELGWLFMTTSQYASLQTIYEADVPVVFNPNDGSSKTYNVEVISLDSDYFIKLDNSAGNHRRNAKMRLLIMSEV